MITEDGYPPDWPRCPACGRAALDGHITCGDAACDEGEQRRGHRVCPDTWSPQETPQRSRRPADPGLYIRYLGAVGLLGQLAPYLKMRGRGEGDELFRCVEAAIEDACKHHGLRFRRVGDRFEIEPGGKTL